MVWPNMRLSASMPGSLVARTGEADGAFLRVQEGAKHMPNVTFVVVPGCDHGEAFQRADLVLPHVTKFLQAVPQKGKTSV